MMKKTITFNELDALCNRLEEMPFKCGYCWPTLEQIEKYLATNPKKNMEFMIWITETASEPKTEEEKMAKKRLLKLINKNITIKDENKTTEEYQ